MNIIHITAYQGCDILNFDQTDIFSSNSRARVLAHSDANQVPIACEKQSVWATAALIITMEGRKLRPYVIVKDCRGPNSWISSSFSRLPQSTSYSVQPNAWVDIFEMGRYIDTILAPFMQERQGMRVLLLLGSFSVHINEGIKERLNNLRIGFLYIPKGMTGILQPLDISVNKPFEDRLKTLYTDWLMSRAIDDEQVLRRSRPTREDISAWMAHAWTNIDADIIHNGFNMLRDAIEMQHIASALIELGNE